MIDKIIEKAATSLREREEARDQAYSRARKARILSKQAILMLHNGETEKAKSNLETASSLLKEITKYSEQFTEIRFYEAVEAAHQEYAEAGILYGLNTVKDYPSTEDLGVDHKDYLLGLADVPGELRRQTLDLLKDGDLEAAESNLATMEEIYLQLTGLEDVSLLLKGLRRKLDVVRMVNERTRAELVAEVSRTRLAKLLEEAEKR